MQLRPVSLPFPNISILQDVKNQAISSDSEFLYQTIQSEYSLSDTKPGFRVLELGTGNGIIAIMLALSFRNWDISALEVQISQFKLAKENVARSSTDIKLVLADFRKIGEFEKREYYDLVIANPPYFPLTEVRISPYLPKTISRYELLCTMDELITAFKWTMSAKGKGFIIYPTSRTSEFKEIVQGADMKVIDEQLVATPSGKETKSKTVFVIAHDSVVRKTSHNLNR